MTRTDEVELRQTVRRIAGQVAGIGRRLDVFERTAQLTHASVHNTDTGDDLDVTAGLQSGIDALGDAAAALAKATSVEATVDGEVTVYYQQTPPVSRDLGDYWVNTATESVTTWDGDTWQPAGSAIAQALLAAQNAKITADGKINTFWTDDPPTGASYGDLWYKTDNRNRPHWWDGDTWQDIHDGYIDQAQSTADDAKSTAYSAQSVVRGKGAVHWQSNPPRVGNPYDVWFDESHGNRPNYWDGSSWQPKPLDQRALDVGSLSAISADLGTITAGYIYGVHVSGGTITGTTVRTSSSGKRVEFTSGNEILFYTSTGTAGYIEPIRFAGPGGRGIQIGSPNDVGTIQVSNVFTGMTGGGTGSDESAQVVCDPNDGVALFSDHQDVPFGRARIYLQKAQITAGFGGNRDVLFSYTSSGKSWIGTYSSSATQQGGIAYADNGIYVGHQSGSSYVFLPVNASTFHQSSSKAGKTNIGDVKGALAKVAAAPSKRWQRNDEI